MSKKVFLESDTILMYKSEYEEIINELLRQASSDEHEIDESKLKKVKVLQEIILSTNKHELEIRKQELQLKQYQKDCRNKNFMFWVSVVTSLLTISLGLFMFLRDPTNYFSVFVLAAGLGGLGINLPLSKILPKEV